MDRVIWLHSKFKPNGGDIVRLIAVVSVSDCSKTKGNSSFVLFCFSRFLFGSVVDSHF